MIMGSVLARSKHDKTEAQHIQKRQQLPERLKPAVVAALSENSIDNNDVDDSVIDSIIPDMIPIKVKGECIKPSWMEIDGTPDNSFWTSCETDGRYETSPDGVMETSQQQVISVSPPKEYEVYPRAFQVQCIT